MPSNEQIKVWSALTLTLLLILLADYKALQWRDTTVKIVNSVRWNQIQRSDNRNIGVMIIAGGRFWELQEVFDFLPGIVETAVGFTAGVTPHPSYENSFSGGHYHAVYIVFNESVITFEDLVAVFFLNIDPLNPEGQFCSIGHSYRSALFYRNHKQKSIFISLTKSVEKILQSPVQTEVLPAEQFYPAEELHQYLYLRNPRKLKKYAANCKREKRLRELYGRLSPIDILNVSK